MTTQHQLVIDFSYRFGIPVRTVPQQLSKDEFKFRVDFMKEELDEFIEAYRYQDLVKQADALLDLVYVVHGTAIMMGLPWEDLFSVVHLANMKKVLAAELDVPANQLRLLDDVRKPPGWQPPEPMLRAILTAAGATL